MESDKAKIVESLFNPDVSVILAELEHGAKESALLASKLGISEDEIKTRLDYLIETGFVVVSDSPISYGVDAEKIAKIMENEENYKNVVDGLTELDSYLN
jgi:predicted ArsR family transcriptional regulator